jgi:hypothetical protein
MATPKGKKAGAKRKRIDASKVRMRDLDAKKGKVVGGGLGGGMMGFSATVIKKG